MELVKDYIFRQVASNKLSQDDAKKMLKELKPKQAKVESDIAVIGIACKFPGAKNYSEYWDNLRNGRECIGDFPPARRKDVHSILLNEYFRKTMMTSELTEEELLEERYEFVKGGYLDEIDKFDAGFFNIPPGEAKFIDPVQRIFMETAWEAIEDAGYGGNKIYGTKTGVFVGRDYTSSTAYNAVTVQDQMHLTGSWTGILATRLSYIFNLRGMGMVIDTACSSGATAIHEACQALKNKECDFAVAGGIYVNIMHAIKGNKSAMDSVESNDGKVKTFDEKANGTVWGEGVGALLLKPLSKALADGDNVYAVIKGSAVNNDGASNGITAPNAEAQEEVIVQAWREAKVNPETISYIEAHGTGTVLGDPIEIKGLINAFGRFTDKKQFCGIGSVKTNVGHLVGASGLASVIKVVLALKQHMLPASLNFDDPNPYINFPESPVYVNNALNKWETGDTPRRAGVSSFGFSGTNCHIILEEAPRVENLMGEDEQKLQIFSLSARSENVLNEYLSRYEDYLSKGIENELKDICYTANTGRGHFNYRVALVVQDIEDLKKKIALLKEKGLNTLKDEGIFYGYHKIIQGNKKALYEGEISEEQKSRISLEAASLVQAVGEGRAHYENSLETICRLYAAGAEFEWDEFYKAKKVKRVPLPVYPLERIRLWAEPREFDKVEIKTVDNNSQKGSHPLFDDNGMESIDSYIFTTKFNVGRHWVLSDHRVLDYYVVPGTTYLEMAREAARMFFNNEKLVMKNVVFINPLVVIGTETKEIQTIIRQEEGGVKFVVAGKSEEGTWIRHAEGSIIQAAAEDKGGSIDLNEIKARCTKQIAINNDENSHGSFGFGPRWKNIAKVFTGENEMLGYLELPAEFKKDLESFRLHPALMDNALNLANSSIGEGLFLPLTYKVLKVFGTTPDRFYSYLKRRGEDRSNSDSVAFDVFLFDENGNVFAQAEDYTVKRVNQAVSRFRELSGKAGLYYELEWVREELPAAVNSLEGEKVLLLSSYGNIGSSLGEVLKARGAKVIEAKLGSEYRKIDDDNFIIQGNEKDYKMLIDTVDIQGISKVINALNVYGTQGIGDIESFKNTKQLGIWGIYHLIKHISLKKLQNKMELILIADYAQEVNGGEDVINPLNAAFLGIGKVIDDENENILCRCIDIDKSITPVTLADEIQSGAKKHFAAYRNGNRYLQQFKKIDTDTKNSIDKKFLTEGVCLITGGTGGIGLEIGKYLAGQGTVNICLVNRSMLPEREEWKSIVEKGEDSKILNIIKSIYEMEAKGAKVECQSADTSSFEDMKSLVQTLKDKYGRINGIIHAAGVAGNGLIINRSEDDFKRVIDAKLDGAWILDYLTRDMKPEFFILFSSIASILGGAGQGDYTAANSFLDSFAYYRSKKGNRTMTINWATWKETGMAVGFGANKDGVFKAINTADAINAFDELLGKDIKRVIVAEPDYGHEVFGNEARLPFYISPEEALRIKRLKEKTAPKNVNNLRKQQSDVKLKGRPGDNYTELEKAIGQIWGTLLGMDEIDVRDSFFELGGNSIIALKLETEMCNSNMQIDYQDINVYPTIAELAAFVAGSENEGDGVTEFKSDIVAEDSSNADKAYEKTEMDEVNGKSVKADNMLKNFEPFNDIIYKGCFYSALFPVVKHYNKDLSPFLVNDVSMYEFATFEGNKKLNVKYKPNESVFKIASDSGIKIDASFECKNIVESITQAIDAEKPVVICVDCYYLSIRPDTFNELHWPHSLAVFGYNNDKKVFHVLEHRHGGSLFYEKREIGYSDIIKAHRGFIENFRNLDITATTYGDLNFHEGEIFPAYFEFSPDNEKTAQERNYIRGYAGNLLLGKDEKLQSIDCLKEFIKEFKKIALDESRLREAGESLIGILNTCINAILVEKHKISLLFEGQAEILDILSKIFDCWDGVRANIGRFNYGADYNENKFIAAVEKMEQAYRLEAMYYEKLYEIVNDELYK